MNIHTSDEQQEVHQTYRRWMRDNALPANKTPAEIAAFVDGLDLSIFDAALVDEAALKNLLRRILLELYAHRVLLRPENR